VHGRVATELACPAGVGCEDVTVPEPYLEQIRDEIGRVARNRGDGVTIALVANDFGVDPVTLSRWMRQAAIEENSASVR